MCSAISGSRGGSRTISEQTTFDFIIDDLGSSDAWDGVFTVIDCKKALSPSRLPGLNFALNPYGGCTHGCIYCYAPEVTHSEWGDWRAVRVKKNVAERLAKELRWVDGTIGIGTVTDPYQDPERRFMLTRRCLEVISRTDVPIAILTKSDLVLRDMELISEMRHTVNITVTTVDDRVSKRTEPGAPLPSRRLDALRTLVDAGMNTTVMVGPIMSTLQGREMELAEAIIRTGVTRASLDRLNPRPLLSERLDRMGIGASPESVEKVKRYLSDAGIAVEDAF